MYVINRNGQREDVQFDKITQRIARLTYNLHDLVDAVPVAQEVVKGLYDGVTTSELDALSAETAAQMVTRHPDYAILASRIAVSNLHKNTLESFSATVYKLYHYIHPVTGKRSPLIADDVYEIVQDNAEFLDEAIVQERDFEFDYFGFRTLERSYLLKTDGQIAERPQFMFMRVAIGIHKNDLEAAVETYNLMTEKWFTHATPTLFNAGTPKPQLSSCFLLTAKDDSISGIFDTLKQCAEISKSAGGIGLSVHNIRATGSYIAGTNGTSNGIVPMLQVFNNTARYVDQGGGKRKGAFAVYLEPWHADIFEFLDLKKNHGKEEKRARDLFYSLWVPDLFMKRVNDDDVWTLMDPHESPGLHDVHSEAFEALYEKYEREGRGRQTVSARKLWRKIVESQIETGTPYILYKDHANRKSNQQNLGTIRSSNLCAEVIEYTSKDEVAVCNLASISLSRCVIDGKFDFERLHYITKVATRNLNKIIDLNYYPVEEARTSNFRHRPIGIGVQGLADAFMKLNYPFESDEARLLNRSIFETMYHAAVEASMEIAKDQGSYETFKGSPMSKGQFQFDLWGVTPTERYDWESLRQQVMAHGTRNSLMLALMPTASTSQILGNNECFEPITSNMYTRRVLSGEFVVVNKYLMNDLIEMGIWNEDVKNEIIANNGSIQDIDAIPEDLKEVYKTVWEIKQKAVIDMAADRGAFICQSQSLNIFMQDANFRKLSSMHFYGWSKGLKTGTYYLRTKAATTAQKVTIDPEMMKRKRDAAVRRTQNGGGTLAAGSLAQPQNENYSDDSCSLDDPDCLSCGA